MNAYKSLMIVMGVAMFTASARPQAYISFRNDFAYPPGDRLVRDVTGAPLVGTNYLAQLYYGPYGTDEKYLVAVTDPPARFRGPTTQSPGTWIGGWRELEGSGSTTAFSLQVRVWDSSVGGTWEQAVDAGFWFGKTQHGASEVFPYYVPPPGCVECSVTLDYLSTFALMPPLTNSEGNVWFLNDSRTLVTNLCTGKPVFSGSNFLAALYYAVDGTVDESLFIPLGETIPMGPQPGQFYGGVRTTPTTTAPGQFALFQVRIWEASYGQSYEQAVVAPPQNGRSAIVGTSPMLRMPTSHGGPPTSLVSNGLSTIILGYPQCVTPGSVLFQNSSAAQVTNFCTGEPIAPGTNFLAAIYYAPTGETNETRFSQLGEASGFGPAAGQFYGGVRSTPNTTVPGGPAAFQVRVWESAYGSTYEQARAAPPQNGRGALTGKSVVFEALTSPGGALAPTLTESGLASFFVGYPECVAPGSVSFQNSSATLVTNFYTGDPVISGETFLAALYYAPDGVTNESFFVPLGLPVGFGPETGRFLGNNRVVPNTTLPGDYAMFQVRVWESSYGTTYEQALVAPPQNGRRAISGKSRIVRVPTVPDGLPLSFPPQLGDFGLTNFFIAPPGWLEPGVVLFQNPKDELVFDSCTGMPIPASSNFLAALYYGPDGVTNDAFLGQIGPASEFGPEPGRITRGVRAAPPTTPPGQNGMFQIRVWDKTYGASYEEAITAPKRDGKGALSGKSAIIRLPTLNESYPTRAPADTSVRAFYVGYSFEQLRFEDSSEQLFSTCTRQPLITGTTYLAALYYAPDEITDEQLFTPIGVSPIGPAPGQVRWGTLSLPQQLPNGTAARFQIRVWESAFGSNYEQAISAPPQYDRLAFTGKSVVARVSLQSECSAVGNVPPLVSEGLDQTMVGASGGAICGDTRLLFAPTNAWHMWARSVAVGDLNGDGILDVLVLDRRDAYDANYFHVLQGIGDGTFVFDAATFTWIGTHNSIALGDFDNDGKVDLALADASPPGVTICHGNGDFSFGPPIYYPLPYEPTLIISGDFNGDGKIDLITADYYDQSLTFLEGHGDGTFGPPKRLALDFKPASIAAGNFDEDCLLDLAVGRGDSCDLSVLRNAGDGTFTVASCQTVTHRIGGLAAGDFNGDGLTDLIAIDAGYVDSVYTGTTTLGGGFSMTTLLAYPDATFVPVASYVFANAGYYLGNPDPFVDCAAVGDFNHDGRPDFIAYNGYAQFLEVYLNQTEPVQLRDNTATTYEDTPLQINVLANDGHEGTFLSISSVTQPANGLVTVLNRTNILYTPKTNFFGTDFFEYSIGGCNAGPTNRARVSITVLPVNDPPIAALKSFPDTAFPGIEADVVLISPNGINAMIDLDGSQSSDVENEPLQFFWSVDGLPPFATSVTVTNWLGLGSHSISLLVSDGELFATNHLFVKVVTVCEALNAMRAFIDSAQVSRAVRNSAGAILNAACEAVEQRRTGVALNQLNAFQNQLAAQRSPESPLLATLKEFTQRIIEAISMMPPRTR